MIRHSYSTGSEVAASSSEFNFHCSGDDEDDDDATKLTLKFSGVQSATLPPSFAGPNLEPGAKYKVSFEKIGMGPISISHEMTLNVK